MRRTNLIKSQKSHLRQRLFGFLIALLLCAGCFAPVAQAATPQQDSPPAGLTFDAEVGNAGTFKYGEWLPVWVEVSNQGANIEGEVRADVVDGQNATAFSVPVSLPTSSRKRFALYVLPNNFSRQMVVTLQSQGKVLASQKINVQPEPNIAFVMGLLAPERGALGLLNAIALPGQERPKVLLDLSLSLLPDRFEGLRTFDVIIANGIDTSTLSIEQSAALTAWVKSGGRLVIGGGSDSLKTIAGLPAELLPVTAVKPTQVDAAALQSLAKFAETQEILANNAINAVTAQVQEAILLAGDALLPLVTEKSIGAGYVDFVALDLAGVPFNGWPGTTDFWKTLLSPTAAFPESRPFDVSERQMRANQLQYTLSNIPSLDLPSLKGLAILLSIYILVIGPINYLILRKIQRLHYAWASIPILTLLFAAGAFSIGYLMRGNDLILNQIAIIQTAPADAALTNTSPDAAVTSYLGLFSPRTQSYEIIVNGNGLVSAMNSDMSGAQFGPNGQVMSRGELVFTQGQPASVRGLSVNQFSMQSFMAEETWQDFGRLTADLTLNGDVLTGWVRNDTSETLIDVIAAYQSRYVRLGDLRPGQEAQVDMGLGGGLGGRFNSPLSYQIFQDQYNQPGGQPSRETDLKSGILSSVLDSSYYNSKFGSSALPVTDLILSGDGGIVRNAVTLFGWVKSAPPKVEVKDNVIASQTTGLVFTTASYRIDMGKAIQIPTGMIAGRLASPPFNGGSCGPVDTASVSMSDGVAEMEFQIPTAIRSENVSLLNLDIWSDSGGPDLPELALWDWQSQSWAILQSAVQGLNQIQSPTAYISESGLVRLRVSSNSSSMSSCTYFDMGLEATRLSGGNP